MQKRGTFEGWALVGWAVLAAAATLALARYLAERGASSAGTDALPEELRLTARAAFLVFALVFSTSSWLQLWPSAASRWAMRNRRALGVSFFVLFCVHGAMILRLASRHPLRPIALVGGGLAFALATAMAATSFDRTAALIGRRTWRVLHGVGLWYLASLFSLAYVTRARHPAYWPELAVVTGMLAMRIATRTRVRSGRVHARIND
jgi:hypothetical protein